MEAKPISEKRKRLSPSLLSTGGFDTSSLDSTLGTKPDAKIRRLEPSRLRFSGRNDVLCRDIVKDLRSHRVFSPSSELYKELSHQKLGFEFGFDDSEDDSKAAKSEDISCKGRSIGEQTGKVDLGFPISAMTDVLDEKSAAKTSNPEDEVSADPRITENCGNGIGKSSKGNPQTKIDSDSKTKPFLRPCFRGKVFKTPGSLSYRRLLPYLMDISNNDSGMGENDRCPKLDKNLEEKSQAMQASQSEVASKDDVDKNRILLECLKVDKVSEEMKPQATKVLQSEEASKDGVDKSTILVEFPELDKVSEEKQPQATQTSQSEEASKDGDGKNRISIDGVDKNRILLECPEVDKVSVEKKPQAMQALQSEESSKDGVDKSTILVEFPVLNKVSEEKQPQAMRTSQNEEDSKDGVGKNRISVECSELDKVPEEKQPQAMQASRSEEASKDGVGENSISAGCRNRHYDTIVQDCAVESSKIDKVKLTSSENVSLSPSAAGADKCWLMPLVNDLQNSEEGLSCKDQKPTNLDCLVPTAVKDLMDTRDDFVNKPVEYVGTIENDSWFQCDIQDGDIPNTEETTSLDVEGQKPNQVNDQRAWEDDEVPNQANNLNEKSNQMTPLDVEIFGKPELEGNKVDGADFVLQNGNPLEEKVPSGVNHGNASLDYNTRHESNSKCGVDLKPRSRMKLFRSPGSLSYRRMLPFLMNITKDNSANGHCANHHKDLERSSPLAFDNVETPSDISNGLGFEESQKDHSAALQMAVQISVQDSSNDKGNEISSEHDMEIQASFISQKEDPLPVKEAVSSTPSEMETSPKRSNLEQAVHDTGRTFASLCFSSCESSLKEELSISNSNQSSVKAERDLSASALESSDGMKSVEEDKLCYATPQTRLVPFSSVTPSGVPKKGILKRNPRGCRGLCPCLNCASFRLHAERGFEFSMNQLEDAGEVVLDLIKELSYLRNVLEKSADAADNHFVNVNQVKEACRKASEAEELAKDRLNQMYYDLGVHCRITCLEPPRVRFANRVEENVILKTSFRSKKVLKQEKEKEQREMKTN